MKGRDDTPEASLVERVIAGDKVAFGRLVEPHLPRLLGLARRMLPFADEAEDALQNALASVWSPSPRVLLLDLMKAAKSPSAPAAR